MNVENSKEVNHKNSLLSQIRDFGVGPIIGMGISMLTVPVTTRLLAPEEFGKSSLFTLFQVLFLLIGLLGLDQSYVRFFNDKQVNKTCLLQNVLFFPLVFCGVLICICVAFFKPISIFLFDSVEIGLMVAFCVFIPILVLNRFLLLQIRMDLRGKIYSLLNIIAKIIDFLVLIFFLLCYQRTFRSIVYSTIISLCINTLIVFLFCDKSFIKQKFSFSWGLQKSMFYFCLPLVPSSLLTWTLNSFDKVGLRTWSTFNELGLYSAAFKIVSLLTIFQTIFTTTWTPIAYKWYEEKVSIQKYEDVSAIVLAIMVFLFSFILVFRNFIMLFLGPEYRETSKIFVFLLFIPVMYTVSETTGLGIGFSKKTFFTLLVVIFSVVINVLGNYLLIPKYGAEGAAISSCVSYIIFFWLRTLFSRRLWFKFKLGKYFLNILFLIGFGINMILWQNRMIEVIIFGIVVVFNSFIILRIIMRRKFCLVERS